MADPFIEPEDVADRWRPLSDSETEVAFTLINDALRLLHARYKNVATDLDTGKLDPDNVVQAVAGAVKRALIAPLEGVDSSTEGAGPFSYSVRYTNAARNLFYTATDDMLIRGYRPRAQSVGYAC